MTEEAGGSTKIVFRFCAWVMTASIAYFCYVTDPLEQSRVLRNQAHIRAAREKLGLQSEPGVVYDLVNGNDGLIEHSFINDEGSLRFGVKVNEKFKDLLIID